MRKLRIDLQSASDALFLRLSDAAKQLHKARETCLWHDDDLLAGAIQEYTRKVSDAGKRYASACKLAHSAEKGIEGTVYRVLPHLDSDGNTIDCWYTGKLVTAIADAAFDVAICEGTYASEDLTTFEPDAWIPKSRLVPHEVAA